MTRVLRSVDYRRPARRAQSSQQPTTTDPADATVPATNRAGRRAPQPGAGLNTQPPRGPPHHRRNRLAASTAIVTTALVAGLIAALSATASTGGGAIRVYAVSDGAPPDHVVVTGAINGAGSNHEAAADHVQLTTTSLAGGTIVTDTTKVAAAVGEGLDAGDRATCTPVFTATVPVTILRGTGTYAGAHGKLTDKISVAAAAPKTGNGHCGPVNVVAWSRDAGSISFH